MVYQKIIEEDMISQERWSLTIQTIVSSIYSKWFSQRFNTEVERIYRSEVQMVSDL
jgi:hypothetical protein